MAGREMSQNRKKHMKSRVFVPEEAGMELAICVKTSVYAGTRQVTAGLRMVFTEGHIARSITRTHEPPMLACTPYQILRSAGR